MSLAIDVDKVTEVLLADGTAEWWQIDEESFMLDSYEFTWRGELTHGGGEAGVCATGFSFKCQDGTRISGPLTAVLAVRHT